MQAFFPYQFGQKNPAPHQGQVPKGAVTEAELERVLLEVVKQQRDALENALAGQQAAIDEAMNLVAWLNQVPWPAEKA